MIPWLTEDAAFPHPDTSLHDPNGLLAAGADLSPYRILKAYRQGIFPWFSEGQPILWWCPDPRTVLLPTELKISRSLSKTLRRGDYEVRLDSNFAAVIGNCAAVYRPDQGGTWISPEMRQAYTSLHQLGFAHSVETWMQGELVGGLYGLAIGRMFYGESMFHLRRDASKIAFAHLVRFLAGQGFTMIDCQMPTAHLASLGARAIPRPDFLERVAALSAAEHTPEIWTTHAASGDW